MQEKNFQQFISDILNRNPNFRNVNLESIITKDIMYRADIVAEEKRGDKWTKLIIELKSFTVLTSKRINESVNQLFFYKEILGEEIIPVLAFPGILTAKDKETLKNKSIEIWDIKYIEDNFKKEIDENHLQKLHNITYRNYQPKLLINQLKKIEAGKNHWSRYEKHIKGILSYLFSDILSEPIEQLSDKENINRRDFIIRNYCENGFWRYLRERYWADFIIIEAKNYVEEIGKDEILQISNYLKRHGVGLFAIIISRNGNESKAAYLTRKEKWVNENKMIIILDDNDIEKMIQAKDSSFEPEEIIKQKIEDFRLEI